MGLARLYLLRPPSGRREQDGGKKGIVLSAAKVRLNPTPAATCLEPDSRVKSLQLYI